MPEPTDEGTTSAQPIVPSKLPVSPKDLVGPNGQLKPPAGLQPPAVPKILTGQAAKEAKKAEKAAKRAQTKGGNLTNGTTEPRDGTQLPDRSKNAGSIPTALTSAKGKPKPPPLKSPRSYERGEAATKPGKPHQGPSASITKAAETSHSNRVVTKAADSNPVAGYLQSLSKPKGLLAASTELHPAIVAVGLRMANFQITGSAARCAALLVAFKSVIRSYRTPSATSLNRNLVQHLSPQIDFIKSCRPLTINMGNAIRWLKFEIATNTDVGLDDETARAELVAKIDRFIASKITLAATAIAELAADRIREGDVIMTYGKSSVVQQALCHGFSEQKKRFQVIVVDDEPLCQGKALAQNLTKLGIPVTLCPFSSLHAVANSEVTKVFLGANAMMSNGTLLARSGTSAVAKYGKRKGAGVFVLCETLKFSDRAPVDSLVLNELMPSAAFAGSAGSAPSGSAGAGAGGVVESGAEEFECAHLMYDLCPAESLDLIITEIAEGAIPVDTVPVVYRMMMDYENQGGSSR